MKFAKGMLIGGILGAGMIILYTESGNSKKIIKKSKKAMKKMGII